MQLNNLSKIFMISIFFYCISNEIYNRLVKDLLVRTGEYFIYQLKF